MEITSVTNPMIKACRALREKKGRAEQEKFLIEGVRLISDALEGNIRLERIFYDGKKPSLAALVARAEEQGIPCVLTNDKVIAALSDTENPQGIVAVCDYFTLSFTPQGKPGEVLIALDGLKDPGNIGTIIRTAEAAGAGAIYISPDCVQKYNPKLIRATMGSFFRLPIFFRDLEEVLAELQPLGYSSVAAALGGADFYVRDLTEEPKLLIIGSEAEGIRPELLERADHRYQLPILGRAESLNAAIAAGIMIYDLKMRG